mgnify:CR=1 FL=1
MPRRNRSPRRHVGNLRPHVTASRKPITPQAALLLDLSYQPLRLWLPGVKMISQNKTDRNWRWSLAPKKLAQRWTSNLSLLHKAGEIRLHRFDVPVYVEFVQHLYKGRKMDGSNLYFKPFLDMLCEPRGRRTYGLGIIKDDDGKYVHHAYGRMEQKKGKETGVEIWIRTV